MPSVYGILFLMKLSLTGLLKRHYPSEYSTWEGIKARCNQKGHKHFKHYGGRGIKICDGWRHSFVNFLLDMGPKPSSLHTIDRRNNAKNYDKSNCRWVLFEVQAKNKRTNCWLSYKKRTMILADWAREFKRPASDIQYHLKNGKSFRWIYYRFAIENPIRRSRIYITYKGNKLCEGHLSDTLNLKRHNFRYWRNKGKSVNWIIKYYKNKKL